MSPTRMLSDTSMASMMVVRAHGSVTRDTGRAAATERPARATRRSSGGRWRRHCRPATAARAIARLL